MKEDEFIERRLSIGKSGILLDESGNEYRNEDGCIEYLELEE
tara:strand:+ start:176 stop:301 length:126 start_codon:yes stop_codon:yes gene_type:complete